MGEVNPDLLALLGVLVAGLLTAFTAGSLLSPSRTFQLLRLKREVDVYSAMADGAARRQLKQVIDGGVEDYIIRLVNWRRRDAKIRRQSAIGLFVAVLLNVFSIWYLATHWDALGDKKYADSIVFGILIVVVAAFSFFVLPRIINRVPPGETTAHDWYYKQFEWQQQRDQDQRDQDAADDERGPA